MWLHWPPCSATSWASPLWGGAVWLLSTAFLWCIEQPSCSFKTGMRYARGNNWQLPCQGTWQGSPGPQKLTDGTGRLAKKIKHLWGKKINYLTCLGHRWSRLESHHLMWVMKPWISLGRWLWYLLTGQGWGCSMLWFNRASAWPVFEGLPPCDL